MDAVFAEAERTDQMIIPCCPLRTARARARSSRTARGTWAAEGTDDENSTRLSFEDWVQTAVNRWKDSRP